MRGVATYQEIRTFWDLNDVVTANEWLDYQDDAEHFHAEEQRSKRR